MDREIARNFWHELFTAYPCVEDRILEKDINELSSRNRALHIDYDVLLGVDFDFAEEILDFPEDMIPLGCSILKDDANLSFAPKIRITNLPNTDEISIRDLRAAHMYKLIQIEGTVRRTSEVKPEIVEARFECVRCGDIISIIQVNSQNFQTPAVCPNEECGRTGPFRLIEQSSRFEDWQNVRIQESPESLRGGEMPRFIDVILREEIVEAGQTGNKAIIVGVLKAIQDTGLRGKKTTYTKYLEANSIIIREKTYEDMELTPEEEERMEEMASDPDIHLKIQRSIAPTIYGHENVKAAIALQQFSNRQRLLPDGTKQRGDIHVLLVGDPGVAKSQMLAYAAFISPRGVYTSGKGASSAGLTAAVLKDEIAGGYTLEAGALVIADNGLACVAKGQRVLTINGLVPIEDVAPGTKVYAYNGHATIETVTKNMYKGVKKTIALETFSGQKLYLTPDHLVLTSKGWEQAKDVGLGGFLKLPCFEGMRQVAKNTDYYKGRIMGFGISDMIYSKKKNQISFTVAKKNMDRAEYYLSLIKEHYGVIKIGEYVRPPNNGLKEAKFTESHVYTWASKTMKEDLMKIFDGRINLDNEEWVQGFITGILDTDTCISHHNGKVGVKHTIEIALHRQTKGEEWLNTINGLLVSIFAMYGIQGYIRRRKVYITSQRSFNLAAQIFGKDLVGRNQGKLIPIKKIRKITTADSWLDQEYLDWFKSVKFITPMTVKLAVASRIWEAANRGVVSQELMETLNTEWPTITKATYKEPTKGYILDKVTHVQEGPEVDVFDISVTNAHNFIVEGHIVHNCVDEIEKMSEDDRSGIHQAMEQQACSISKAGIMATLNTRCAILAAANPKRGRFDSHNPLPNQTELEPTILSRFDLIFFMADRPKRETDTLISDHILKTHAGELAHITPEVSIEDIKKYVIYQKKRIPHVMLSSEAKTRLQDYYVDLRVKGETGAIPITARQLQSLVRLASARARMRGNTTASIEDANAVLDIYEAALGDSAMDYESGELDIDMIMTGKPKSQRDNMTLVLDIIESLDKKSDGKGALRSEVATDAQAEGISGDKLWRMIKDLKESGDVYEPTPDRLKLTLERVHIGG